MSFSKINPAMMALAMLCFMAGSAIKAQGGQRRVLTNDDVASPAPAPERPAEPGSSATPTPPAASAASSDVPAASPPAPQGQLAQLTNIVEALGQASDILADRIREGTADETTLARWNTMRESVVNLLLEFRDFADQARAAAPAVKASPAPAESQPAPSAP